LDILVECDEKAHEALDRELAEVAAYFGRRLKPAPIPITSA
jgi:hypothetical protein